MSHWNGTTRIHPSPVFPILEMGLLVLQYDRDHWNHQITASYLPYGAIFDLDVPATLRLSHTHQISHEQLHPMEHIHALASVRYSWHLTNTIDLLLHHLKPLYPPR